MSPKTSEIHEIGPSTFEHYSAAEPSILFLPGSNDSEDETRASFSIVLAIKQNMQISEVIDGNGNRHLIADGPNVYQADGDITMLTFTQKNRDASTYRPSLSIEPISANSLADLLKSRAEYFEYIGVAEINDFFSSLAKHKTMQSDEARSALLDAILALDQQISEVGVSEPELSAPVELFDVIESRIAGIMGNSRRRFFNAEPAELPAEIITLNRLRNLDGYKNLFANHVFTEEEAIGIMPIPNNEELSHRPLRTGALEQNGLSYNTFTTLLTLARNFDAFDKPNNLKGLRNKIFGFKKTNQQSHPDLKQLKQAFGPAFINSYLTLLSEGHISIRNTELTKSGLHTFSNSHNPFNY